VRSEKLLNPGKNVVDSKISGYAWKGPKWICACTLKKNRAYPVSVGVEVGKSAQSYCRYCVRGKLVSVGEDTYWYVARIRSVVWGSLLIICLNVRARTFPANTNISLFWRQRKTQKNLEVKPVRKIRNFGRLLASRPWCLGDHLYGQTPGLSNWGVKHVSELATIGFIPRKVALISQSVSFVSWLLLHTYYKDICPE